MTRRARTGTRSAEPEADRGVRLPAAYLFAAAVAAASTVNAIAPAGIGVSAASENASCQATCRVTICELDEGTYQKGRKVSNDELETVQMERWDFHGEWNYTIYPAPT